MPKPFLLDTNILIDFNRAKQPAVEYILALSDRPLISVITIIELYAGVREGRERLELDAFVASSKIVDLDARIAERAGLMLRKWMKSHGTGFADAAIAATAEIEGATLGTLNRKHFPMVADLLVPYAKT